MRRKDIEDNGWGMETPAMGGEKDGERLRNIKECSRKGTGDDSITGEEWKEVKE